MAQASDNNNYILADPKGAEWESGCKSNYTERIGRKWVAVNQFECKTVVDEAQ